jgi:flagellar hook-associated protein 3 FlgL
MRISSANAYETSISNLQTRQQALTDAQQRLTSGKRVEQASDDPVAAARAERALAAMVRSEADQRALNASKNVMTQTESALGDAGDLMQQARELIVQAGNGSYDDTNRMTLSKTLKGIRDQLLSIANRTDGAGTYLFGGQGTQAPPFVDAPGGVQYLGTSGQTTTPSAQPMQMSSDGGQVWLEATNPTPPGVNDLSVFNVLDRVIGQLGTSGQTGPQVQQIVSDGLRDVDATANHLLAARAAAGDALNRTDQIEQRIADSKLAAQTARTNAVDLDMVQAISDFQNKQRGYDAALKTYSTVQRLSLFQYLTA